MTIFRYLVREVIQTMLVMILILLIIMLSIIFVRYLSEAATGSMSLATVVSMVGVILPGYVALLIPVSFFLSIVLVYGKLFADSELLVLFACGFSWCKLALFTLLPALVLTIIVSVLSLYVMPIMHYHKKNLEQIAHEHSDTLSVIKTGRFLSVNDGKEVIYIGGGGQQDSDQDAGNHHIFIYRDLGDNKQITLAPTGYMSKNNDGSHSLVLKSGRSYQGNLTAKKWRLVDFKTYTAQISAPVSDHDNTDLESMSTGQLLHHMTNAKWAEFQWRMSLPLATIVITLLGVAICYVAPRRGRYSKMLNALLVFILYFNILSIARSWVASGALVHWLGLWSVHLLFLIFAIIKLYRLDTGKWPIPALKRSDYAQA